jgi:hypothetical protein
VILFGTVRFETLQVKNSWTYLIGMPFKFQRLSLPPTTHCKGMVMYLMSIEMSNCQMSLSLKFWTDSDHLLDHVSARIFLPLPVQTGIDFEA